ncbi:ABC transporter permease [Corynebacterium breve]|uniref:ABC transporter permease n=1 Tax=Corynebacterium breve TaxID=3049799 RepID=A0ABY8VCS6_9CORY|nr:ABC transporter permease [Corynebacterium breve]WIM67470.1 ABC transporter permease [Corynebacterium breve]
MNFTESLRLAASSLRANKMRSLLTLLGVIIGIASVIAILTIGSALRTQTVDGLANLGAADIAVSVQQRDEDTDNPYMTSFKPEDYPESLITEEMLDQATDTLGDNLAGYSMFEGDFTSGDLSVGTSDTDTTSLTYIEGVNENSLPYSDIKIVAGRGIDAEDVESSRAVGVISEKAVDELFSGDTERALGSELRFAAPDYETPISVVGVYSSSSGEGIMAYEDPLSRAYLPYPVVRELEDLPEGFARVSFRPAPEVDANVVRSQLEKFFEIAYEGDEEAEAAVTDFSNDMQQVNDVINNISMAVSAIAGISLLVGGIGVMNIMLVSVTERTREIGIRKALGATRGAIKQQFVVEAMMVCLLGGVIGVALGGLLGYAGSAAFGAAGLPPVSGVLIALAFSLGIGLFFGYYPAAKAAKLDPIEALRYE